MNEQEQKTYKSPTRKLVRFFNKSRDQWKAKCLEAKAIAKGLKHRIRYLEQSKMGSLVSHVAIKYIGFSKLTSP